MCVAFSMYSKIPMPQVEWTKESMQYCICFFPAVGAVIGAATLLWNMLVGAKLSGSLLFTAVLILIPVLITGGIHLDGLLDTADALSSYKTKEEKLEILKDSHAGAFAIIIGICWFVLDFGIYSEADAHEKVDCHAGAPFGGSSGLLFATIPHLRLLVREPLSCQVKGRT